MSMTRVLPGLLAMLLIMLLVACGGEDTDEDSESDAASTAQTTATSTDTDTSQSDVPTPTTPPTAVSTSPSTSGADDAAITVSTCDTDFTYDEVPQRVITIDFGALDLLLALGLQDQVIGHFGSLDDLLPEHQAIAEAASIPILGESWPIPSFEAVLAEDPDFIFSYGYDEETGFTIDAVAAAGIGNYSWDEACPNFSGNIDFETLFDNITNIGQIFRVEDQAADLIASYEERLAAASAMVPADAETPQVFHMDFGADTIFTAAAGAMPTFIIEAAGGENIFADTEGDASAVWYYATHEEIVERDPDIIVIIDYGDIEERISFLEGNPALSGITAVQNEHYLVLSYPQIVPGPQNINAVEDLAEGLWGADGLLASGE